MVHQVINLHDHYDETGRNDRQLHAGGVSILKADITRTRVPGVSIRWKKVELWEPKLWDDKNNSEMRTLVSSRSYAAVRMGEISLRHLYASE